MIDIVPPGFILIIGALLIPFLKGGGKKAYMLLLPVISFVNLIHMPDGQGFVFQVMDQDIILGNVDRLSLIFGYIFHLVLLITVIYSLHLDDDIQHVSCMIYAGSAVGAVFAGDMFSLFLFWEMLTVSATLLIWARRTKAALGAGMRYLMIHAAGGLCLLAGIVLRVSETGSAAFGYIGLEEGFPLSSLLIFLGFGVNCAWPFLHNWLTDAYPEATVTGTIALSAFTTKTAVYVLARAYPGTEALIYIGAAMAAFPIFFAVIENDMRRVLAYSLVNQVGFMVVGIGIGTELAVNGAVCHAFNDILFKGLLFMSMGAVLYRTGKINATDLGGLYRTMPLTCIFCCVGAASISAFPFFSGFVSKSMVMTAAGNGHMHWVWLILLFASAGVFHHAGIKIPFFAFFGHDSGLRPKEAPKNMLLAMGIAAFLCILIGSYPRVVYDLLPYPVDYEPYTAAHVVSQTQLLFFSALAFSLLLLSGIYPPEMRAINLDADFLYRKGSRLVYLVLDRTLNGLNAVTDALIARGLTGAVNLFFVDAPRRLVLLVLSPVLPAKARERINRAFRTGISPVGLSVASATLFLFIFMIYTLSR